MISDKNADGSEDSFVPFSILEALIFSENS